MKTFAAYVFTLSVLLFLPTVASGQLVQQSELTVADQDPAFRLTLEHLAAGSRGLGVSPRALTWSPDGATLYFRWREDPSPEQEAATDPWYAVDAAGTAVRRVSDDEAALIPAGNLVWSQDRGLAAWSQNGMLFLWTQDRGTQSVFANAEGLGDVVVASDGSRIFFATTGLGFQSQEQGDLWVHDVALGLTRQVAEVVDAPTDPSSFDAWLEEQQVDLIETVRQRKRNAEAADSLRQRQRLGIPQRIPVASGAVVQAVQLSPDGQYLTFRWMKQPSGNIQSSYMEYVNESGEATARRARPKVGEPLASYKMGILPVDPLVPVDSIEVTWVDDGTDKETVVHGPYWNPQGTAAVVQILSMDHKERWISLLDVSTGHTTVLDHQQEDAWIGGPLVVGRWSPGYLQWLPDGQSVAFASTATGWSMLYLADLDGTITQLTDGAWEVRDAELSADGSTWYLTTSAAHPGEEHLYHLPARGGALTHITQGEGKYNAVVSPNGARLAVTYETPLLMPDLYLMDNAEGAETTRITKSGTDLFYRYAWQQSELVSYPDKAGEETWAEVWERPENSNGAAVIYAHGCGECAQAVDKGWTRIGSVLYANYMLQRGYTMASIDYRGSSGYGHANRTYAYRQMGISDIDSGLPLIDILVEQYGVDRDKVGVYGGSYGGFYTLMSLFRHPGTYAAGVALYPVTDWAHYNQGYTSRILNGTPLTDPEAYEQSSPIYYAEGLQDALQIQHGVVDGNVQIQDSFRLIQRLIELGKDFDLVTYPMEGHGWREVSSRRDSYKRMTRLFDQCLLNACQAASQGTDLEE